MRKRIGIFFICTLLIGTGFLPMINSDDPIPIASNINGWWNTDWQYCKLLTIDNAVNDYQMLINVSKNSGGDVNCNNHCKDDFGDIRFVDIDNTTCLSYWIETKVNSYFVRIWVKLPSDIENDGKILMYYGNPTAQTISNGEQTFVFFDDFDDYNTDIWDEYDPTNKISVNTENGLLHIAYGSVSSGTTAGVITNESVTMYGRVVARLKAERGSNSWNMPLHLYLHSDSENFMQNIYRDTGTASSNQKYNIQFCAGGTYYVNQYSSESYPSLEWRIFYLEKSQDFHGAGAFNDYYNGDRIGNEATWDYLTAGGDFKIRLFMRSFDSGLDGYYDWVFVTNFNQTEPFVSNTGNEIINPIYVNQPPIANFIYSPEKPLNTSVIHFTDTSTDSDGTITGWWWNFDDGYYSDLQNPVHCYYVNGTYTVNLTVTDDKGGIDAYSSVIIINIPVEAIQNLINDVLDMGLPSNIENDLISKLNHAINFLNNNKPNQAISQLLEFINKVESQRGKKITEDQADYLVTAAQSIIVDIGGINSLEKQSEKYPILSWFFEKLIQRFPFLGIILNQII